MIQPVIEGHGEDQAFPTLLRRLLAALGTYAVDVAPARRCPKDQMVDNEQQFKRMLDLVRPPELGIYAIIFLFDADDDCARKYVPQMRRWVEEAAPVPTSIVMVTREYEAWFLAALESLRGKYGIADDAIYEGDPEQKRDAKGALRQFMPNYRPATYQEKLSAVIDLALAYQKSPTFRRLTREVLQIAASLGGKRLHPVTLDGCRQRNREIMSYSPSVDVAIIGGGHNGLVCANYLQRAGLSTAVFERRPIVGGAVCTEEIVPGYKFDVGSSVHIMVHQTAIVEELDLKSHGLEYCPMDPWATYPLPDRSGRAICFYRNLERTCESIAAVSPADARAYKAFIEAWTPVARGSFRAFVHPPTMANLGRYLVMAKGPAKGTEESLRRIFTGYGRLIAETFESGEMRAALGWLAAQSGPPPQEMGSAPFAVWHAMIHETGAAHPKGGSGMLTQALASSLVAKGGEVHLDAPVERIVVEGGKAVGVAFAGGEVVRSRAVVAACHVMTTFRRLLRSEDVPGDLLARLNHVNVGNGFGATVRCASDEMPDYGPAATKDVCVGMQLLCPTDAALRDAYADYLRGLPSERPPVLAMTFSPIDDTLAPPGKHVLSFWSQYFPYKRRDGRDWDGAADEMADSILETVYEYAPNLRGAITDRYIQTPLEIERRLGLIQGNVMHLEMSLDQMFGFRPLPELAQYATPLSGLYLCGASTHPGGGVFGASGMNAAAVVQRSFLPAWRRLF